MGYFNLFLYSPLEQSFALLQLTDELEQSFDRRGRRLEPIKSALDLHRERFAQRMESSTADRTR